MPVGWDSDPMNIILLSFLIDSTKAVSTPICLGKLAEEFKEQLGTPQSIDTLVCRMRRFRLKIQEIDIIDMETRVKMAFAMSAPIKEHFLEELRKDPEVEISLDEHHKIIGYKKGELVLKGAHISRSSLRKSLKNDMMLDFLAQKSAGTRAKPICDSAFVREFQQATGVPDKLRQLGRRFKLLKNKIYQSDSFDEQTKIRMMFVSSTSVTEDILAGLRKDAVVEVDDENHITKYKSDSLELEGDHSRSAKWKSDWHHAPRNHSLIISNYYFSENSGEKNESRMEKLIKFIGVRCENVQSPLSVRQLAKDFQSESGSTDNIGCLMSRFRKYRSEICKLDGMEVDRKVKQLFGLSVPVDADCLEGLRATAQVEVDEQNRITKYQSDTLNLQGDHSGPAKTRSGMEAWKNRRAASKTEEAELVAKAEKEPISTENGGGMLKRKNLDDYFSMGGSKHLKGDSTIPDDEEHAGMVSLDDEEDPQELLEPEEVKLDPEQLLYLAMNC